MNGIIYARRKVLTDRFVNAWLMRRKTGFRLLKRILTAR